MAFFNGFVVLRVVFYTFVPRPVFHQLFFISLNCLDVLTWNLVILLNSIIWKGILLTHVVWKVALQVLLWFTVIIESVLFLFDGDNVNQGNVFRERIYCQTSDLNFNFIDWTYNILSLAQILRQTFLTDAMSTLFEDSRNFLFDIVLFFAELTKKFIFHYIINHLVNSTLNYNMN